MTRNHRFYELQSLLYHLENVGRLCEDPDAVIARVRSNISMLRRVHGEVRGLAEWERLLRGPCEALMRTMRTDDEHGRELRHQSPFFGVMGQGRRKELRRLFRRQYDGFENRHGRPPEANEMECLTGCILRRRRARR